MLNFNPIHATKKSQTHECAAAVKTNQRENILSFDAIVFQGRLMHSPIRSHNYGFDERSRIGLDWMSCAHIGIYYDLGGLEEGLPLFVTNYDRLLRLNMFHNKCSK